MHYPPLFSSKGMLETTFQQSATLPLNCPGTCQSLRFIPRWIVFAAPLPSTCGWLGVCIFTPACVAPMCPGQACRWFIPVAVLTEGNDRLLKPLPAWDGRVRNRSRATDEETASKLLSNKNGDGPACLCIYVEPSI